MPDDAEAALRYRCRAGVPSPAGHAPCAPIRRGEPRVRPSHARPTPAQASPAASNCSAAVPASATAYVGAERRSARASCHPKRSEGSLCSTRPTPVASDVAQPPIRVTLRGHPQGVPEGPPSAVPALPSPPAEILFAYVRSGRRANLWRPPHADIETPSVNTLLRHLLRPKP
jgi:hypothetical protein